MQHGFIIALEAMALVVYLGFAELFAEDAVRERKTKFVRAKRDGEPAVRYVSIRFVKAVLWPVFAVPVYLVPAARMAYAYGKAARAHTPAGGETADEADHETGVE